MGLKTQLLEGKKIRFNSTDIDTWSYSETTSTLNQWISNQQTEEKLTVLELNEYIITINWENELNSNLYEADLELIN